MTMRLDDVAVIGFACRFPNAPTSEAFWALLRECGDAVTEVPPARWDWRRSYDADPSSGRKTNSRWGGFLDGIEAFDAAFFNIAPREARVMDPQQRLLLEVAWEALEHAGRAGGDLADAPVGVFVGCSHNGYYARIAPALQPGDYTAGISNQNAVIPNRVSFFLNLHGPSMLVDTMCSSSLVAIHVACQSLRSRECTMALAGGVNLLLSPEYYVAMSRMKAHAPDGRCKTFDHRANGIVLGEGAGVVVLKPLARAIEEGDTIHGVIRGSAVNHGGQANGLSAPNPRAQADLIRSAMRAADVAPATVSYVEAHGTGTALGDPVEVEGLLKAFGPAGGREPWCRLGSVKTNIGHLECAAGISAFIKVLLAMHHRELPALGHFEKANPLLRLAGTPFRLATELEPWIASGPLRAGVSSFGISGTNAHVVLEEAPPLRPLPATTNAPQLIVLSAKTPTALAALRRSLADFLDRHPVDLRDVAFTLQRGRSHLPFRWAAVCESMDALVSALRAGSAAAIDAIPDDDPQAAFLAPDRCGSESDGSDGIVAAGCGATLEALADLYRSGAHVRWEGFEQTGRRIPLATYPFERRRHWIDLIPTVQDTSPPAASGGEHPLLGRRVDADGGPAAIFESVVAFDQPAFLAEHRIGATALFPATGFFELALAAGSRVFGRPIHVEDIALHQPLRLDMPRRVQTIAIQVEAGLATLQCLSAPAKGNEALDWTLHATGRVRLHGSDSLSKATIEVPDGEEVDVDDLYADLRRRGFDLGPSFRNLRSLRRSGSAAAGIVEWSGPSLDKTLYTAHPALLDACLHALAATFSNAERRDAGSQSFVPVGCARLALPCALPTRFRVEARRVGDLEANGFSGDVCLFDETGRSIGWLSGVRFQRLPATPFETAPGDRALHELRWMPAPGPSTSLDPPGRVLMFADAGGIGDALAARLESRGFSCVRVRPGAAYAILADGSGTLDPENVEHARRLLSDPAWSAGSPLRRVVHLWTLDAPPATDQLTDTDIDAAQALGCASVLHLTGAMSAAGLDESPRLCVITRLGQATGFESRPVDFLQSLPWGLGRTIALEHPDLRPLGIDVDGLASIDALAAEVLSEEDENQVALRGGSRRVARLVRADLTRAGGPVGSPLRLEAAGSGLLDEMAWQPAERSSPGPGEVEIRVDAAALNFRDVLTALGVAGLSGPLGGECAGEVVAAGAGVRDVAVGDRVVAAAPGSFATHVIAPAHLVAQYPLDLRPEEASTIPVAFLTAMHALRDVANLQPGERVLIHAAAGGVGLAAVQVAQQCGAEIFATAGSPEKRAFLSSLGVPHVMDSRSFTFVEDVWRTTGGRGVAVVLNSLSGEFIPRGLDAVGDCGRFVEIGKIDVWTPEQVAAVRPDIRYAIVALDRLAEANAPGLRALFEQVMAAMRDGHLRPLPYRAFTRSETVDAFRHMAQARHIGKVVVSMRDRRGAVRPDAAYLITGGLGALGLHMAQALVDRGARHLTLAGLVEPEAISESARRAVEDLQRRGVSVIVVKADITRREDTRCLLNEARRDGHPLAGVIHAAGVLDDGVVDQLTYQRFKRVLAPKVAGSIHLHQLTAADPLDFIVFFSSMIGIFGSPGQASYASANAFMDSLAQHRHARALPALSLDWGPWSQGGMAHQSPGGKRWIAQGIAPLEPADGVAMFWRALSLPRAQLGVLPVDWATFASRLTTDPPPLLTMVCADPTHDRAASGSILEALEQTMPSERRRALADHLRREAAAVLDLPDAEHLDPRRSFLELGMDSLTAVDFRNRLFRSLGQRLAATLIFDHPTIEDVTDYLAREVFGWEARAARPVATTAGPETSDDLEWLVASVESLSEDAARAWSRDDHV